MRPTRPNQCPLANYDCCSSLTHRFLSDPRSSSSLTSITRNRVVRKYGVTVHADVRRESENDTCEYHHETTVSGCLTITIFEVC